MIALIVCALVAASLWIGFRAGTWWTQDCVGRLLADLVRQGKLDADVVVHPERYIDNPKSRHG